MVAKWRLLQLPVLRQKPAICQRSRLLLQEDNKTEWRVQGKERGKK
jgi:hypothetical protein